MSAKEFQEMIRSTSIVQDKKGRLKSNELSEPLRKVVKGNKKIRNASKHEWNGIVFDSKLEMDTYKRLKYGKEEFIFHKTFIIISGFKYGNKTYLPITWTPDFVFNNLKVILETKGFPNDVFPVKLKLFHKYLHDNCMEGWKVIVAKNNTEVADFIVKYGL